MKFVKDATYFVASNSHSHMCIAENAKGIRYISEPTTRNQVCGRIDFETPLIYVGRSKALQGPAFKLPDGTLVRGHENNFDLDTEYNMDKMRNRGETNAANTKPEKLVDSVKALFGTLGARDLKLACELARELEKTSAQKLADQIVDQMIAEEAKAEAEAAAAAEAEAAAVLEEDAEQPEDERSNVEVLMDELGLDEEDAERAVA